MLRCMILRVARVRSLTATFFSALTLFFHRWHSWMVPLKSFAHGSRADEPSDDINLLLSGQIWPPPRSILTTPALHFASWFTHSCKKGPTFRLSFDQLIAFVAHCDHGGLSTFLIWMNNSWMISIRLGSSYRTTFANSKIPQGAVFW